jgi:VIT1/CCC1 family predicted Fe2+/Mn2+ transporter
VGIAAIIGSLIPLAPFFLLPVSAGIWVAVPFAALILFIVGVIKARLTVGHPGKSGLELAFIGTISALAGYLVGVILKVPAAQ